MAMHPDKNLVSKYMKSLLIGRLEFESSQKACIQTEVIQSAVLGCVA